MKNDLDELQGILFDTLRDLRKSGAEAMDLDRAQTIASVAQVAVEAAKTEVAFMKTTGAATGGKFFPSLPAPAGTPNAPRLVHGKAGGR